MTLPDHVSSASLIALPGYLIVEQLYQGSRTTVYRAIQTSTQRPVVLKLLCEYPTFAELVQFRNQYTVAKNLPIAGIVHPLRLETWGSRSLLVMEDVGSVSLSHYLKQSGKQLDLPDVLKISIQLAEILHELSQHRVIHKDIKPANILLHPQSKQVKLIDFSIASLLPRETQEILNPNVLEGTLAYLAPEQTGRMNRGIDYRTDFYALGVTLYQLLSGQLPFESVDPLELVHCHIAKVPLPLHQVTAGIPLPLSKIVAKLMAKNAEERYQSALGLKHDLEQCLVQWENTGTISEFVLGRRDVSDRFLIPEQLYGREAEVQVLLKAFDRVAQGASELMLVAGFSGIGKTAVVNEVHKPITQQKGYFIKGKFDQFNRNIPLSAFVQALRDLMGQLLSEPDAQLTQCQAQILEAVGDNGQVLIEVIPELENVIGQQPPAPELSGSAVQNRFNLLFQKFIQVFSTAAHPLTIFLDDLQWADSASLQLLKVLMESGGYLLVLGAYRDNEVSPAHPLMLTIEELKKADLVVNMITLTPLALEHTNHLVADTLRCSRELAQPLAQLVNRKTQGNPFFTTQFLKALYDEGCITFQRNQGYWQCDMTQVNGLALTDDVVEFMALQLQKLPVETQQVLKLAACMGNQFDLATLAIVSEQSQTNVATALWKALQEGLVIPQNETYKFFQGNDPAGSDRRSEITVRYKFLHDRIQQAAYSLIPDQEKQSIHYSIGQLLLNKIPESQQSEKIFDIVNQLNYGMELADDQIIKNQLTRLNLLAARKAKAANAYAIALKYLTVGINLLDGDRWQNNYDLTLTLYVEATEAAYLCTNFEQMQQLAEVVLQSATSLLDKIKVYEIKILAYAAQMHLQEAVEMGLQILQLLGVEFPEQPTFADIQQGLTETSNNVQQEKLENLILLPEMTDPEKLGAMLILSSIAPSVFKTTPTLYPLIVFAQVNLSIKYGNTYLSAFAYSGYGLILCGVFQNIKLGYQVSNLAKQLLSKLNANKLKAKILAIDCGYIRHWHEHLKVTLPDLKSGYQAGLESGDLEFTAYCIFFESCHLFYMGEDLQVTAEYMETCSQLIHQLRQEASFYWNGLYRLLVANLMGHAFSPCDLQGNRYSEEQLLLKLLHANDRLGLHILHSNRMTLNYLFGRNDPAVNDADLALEYLDGVTGMFAVPVFYFYDSLIQMSLVRTNHSDNSISDRITSNQQKLQQWSEYAPTNYLHKFYLIEAEQYRVTDNKYLAGDLYDRAISLAKENQFLQEESLANELAAKFYLDWGKEKVAAGYMQEAYYCYTRWGAKAKVIDLEKRYPQLLQPILQATNQPLTVLETLAAIVDPAYSLHSTSQKSSSSSINQTLDFTTLLQMSQTFASTIALDELLQTLTQTMIENSGADRCALMLCENNQWQVQVMADLEQVTLQSAPLENNPSIPVKLIQYVKNMMTMVVIDDLDTDLPVIGDYLHHHQPKSVLCLPILNQGNLRAILYLENCATSGVFTGDRILILNFLCTQASISLENARLYQQAQSYAQQLEQSQLQIVQSEKMASLGNLVAGVAHEINNPIGFLNGSINNAKDSVSELLGHLTLYQQHYPNPVAPIQDNAEDIDLEYLLADLPKLLNSMEQATDRIKNISTSLRTFSRADTEYKVSANLHEGLESTLLILKYRLKANEQRPEIDVIRNYGDLPLVYCFPGQLNQVFMNVLANAIDMFDEMAQARTCEELNAKPQQITLCTEREGDQVLIRVRDNGRGMSEEVQAKIFDHLFTTKGVGKGTGLGLAISRQIVVEKHGGSLEVQSGVGQGSEFLIRLPIES
ncbi:trifunctional serine/threonine-protein kinase/ATP-binding protein/sensor histidine kinase [Leptolyngbya sp. AN02str]|uniref:trifunctional serine/threonine-protein kinase/ATP-binding protein/sensor histidine kinase n=1 Tax=Leptolyngbya sp. AN02str TaxID=3423363 RepID=UPI003D321107